MKKLSFFHTPFLFLYFFLKLQGKGMKFRKK